MADSAAELLLGLARLRDEMVQKAQESILTGDEQMASAASVVAGFIEHLGPRLAAGMNRGAGVMVGAELDQFLTDLRVHAEGNS